jgi:mRNA-degrading endonuclease RelE of RelBE toxin-antitoxin system
MAWQVEFTKKAVKQVSKLNARPKAALRLLVEDLKTYGACPGNAWPNYGKLKAQKGQANEDRRHCHLIKGKPTYVCCWTVVDSYLKQIEVYYVGTHEKAPY